MKIDELIQIANSYKGSYENLVKLYNKIEHFRASSTKSKEEERVLNILKENEYEEILTNLYINEEKYGESFDVILKFDLWSKYYKDEFLFLKEKYNISNNNMIEILDKLRCFEFFDPDRCQNPNHDADRYIRNMKLLLDKIDEKNYCEEYKDICHNTLVERVDVYNALEDVIPDFDYYDFDVVSDVYADCRLLEFVRDNNVFIHNKENLQSLNKILKTGALSFWKKFETDEAQKLLNTYIWSGFNEELLEPFVNSWFLNVDKDIVIRAFDGVLKSNYSKKYIHFVKNLSNNIFTWNDKEKFSNTMLGIIENLDYSDKAVDEMDNILQNFKSFSHTTALEKFNSNFVTFTDKLNSFNNKEELIGYLNELSSDTLEKINLKPKTMVKK